MDDAVTRRHGDAPNPGDPGRPVDPVVPAAADSAAQVAQAVAASRPPRVAVSDVLSWLDARPAPPPPELRERMAGALAGVSAETVPGALAEAALACLQATMSAPAERASALDLLATDALLTYALEAAAELGAEALQGIVEDFGPDRLGALLPEEGKP